MAKITKLEEKSEQKSRLGRLSGWICMPFRRGPPSSYIDPTPPIRETEEAEIPVLPSIAYIQQHIRVTEESSRYNKIPEDERLPRSRYRGARPRSQVPPPLPPIARSDERDHARGRSNSVVARSRESPSPSPDQEALQTSSQSRSRRGVNETQGLPQQPQAEPEAQPPPLTRASLEMNSRRMNWDNQRALARICDKAAPQSGGLPLPKPIIVSDTGPMQSAPRTPRSNSQTRHSWHGNEVCQQDQINDLSDSREDSPRRRHSQRSLPPPGAEIVPLRGDNGKVLVHSQSRGYKIVRNLVSLNGLRDMVREHGNEPRQVASLERMAEEDRRASQELFS